jgi:hypothetical protein
LAGEAITSALFAREHGRDFRGGKQGVRDPAHRRLMAEFQPTREQRTAIHEAIAKEKQGGPDLSYDDLRQIFIDIVGKRP